MARDTDPVRRWHNTRRAFWALQREQVEDRATTRANVVGASTVSRGQLVRRFLKSDPDAAAIGPNKWRPVRPELWRVLGDPAQGRVLCEPLGRPGKTMRQEPKYLDVSSLSVVPRAEQASLTGRGPEPSDPQPQESVPAPDHEARGDWPEPSDRNFAPPRRSARLATKARE